MVPASRNTPVYEVTGVDFVNKGAELMLHSVLAQMSDQCPSAVPALAVRTGSFGQRQRLHAHHVLRFGTPRLRRVDSVASRFLNGIPRRVLGDSFVRERDISSILDASGFAYSDQWAPSIAASRVDYYERWKQPDKPLILLPQAMGPFKGHESAGLANRLLSLADLVFVRDRQSLSYVETLDAYDPERTQLVPDITVLLEPVLPSTSFTPYDLIIVPNSRMYDTAGLFEASTYERLLVDIAVGVKSAGWHVAVAAHEVRDIEFSQAVALKAGTERISLEDPRELKAQLGTAGVVLSSRFHALVSALSQGVPALALGWSHKYEELLSDFGARQGNLAVDLSADAVINSVIAQLDPYQQKEARRAISHRAGEQKQLVKAMWTRIFALLSSKA